MPKQWTQKIDTFYSKGIFHHFPRDRFLQHFAVVSSSIWFLLLLVITFSVRSSSRRSANKWIALMIVFESIFGLGTALILVSVPVHFVSSLNLKPEIHDLMILLFVDALCLLFVFLAIFIMAMSIWDGGSDQIQSTVPDSMRVLQLLFEIVFIALYVVMAPFIPSPAPKPRTAITASTATTNSGRAGAVTDGDHDIDAVDGGHHGLNGVHSNGDCDDEVNRMMINGSDGMQQNISSKIGIEINQYDDTQSTAGRGGLGHLPETDAVPAVEMSQLSPFMAAAFGSREPTLDQSIIRGMEYSMTSTEDGGGRMEFVD